MKKTFSILFIILSSSFFTLKAQGVWTPRNTLPYDSNAMFQGISGFSVGQYGYAGLGNTLRPNIASDELWQYDPAINSWTKKASFPGQGRIAPALFVIGNNAYLVTGSVKNSGACVKECWQYNATTNIWKQKANFPGGARTYAVGFAINGKGYVGTGANELSDFYKDFYAYDTATNTWTRIADFPSIARDGSSGFGLNGKGYVCFGQDSTFKSYKDMWEYDPVTDKWTQKADKPSSPMVAANGFIICNNIYVGIGDTTSSIDDYRGFWKYNTVMDSWTQEANIPGIKRIQGAAFSIEDTGYSGFGWDSLEIAQNAFYKFYAGDSCNVSEGYQMLYTNSEIKIYPNPFNEKCNIQLPDIFNDVPEFALFNMEGVKQKMEIQGNGLYYTIERNDMNEGVYILSVKYNDLVYYKKLVIIN